MSRSLQEEKRLTPRRNERKEKPEKKPSSPFYFLFLCARRAFA
jgi:hypothetical protein